MLMPAALLEMIQEGRDLPAEKAVSFMEHLVGGTADAGYIEAALLAMNAKGPTATELASFAEVLRSKSIPFDHNHEQLVDTCGTGGGVPTFNLSTGSALLAAGTGAFVAKHGNRAVTSTCGSADVLEACGVRLDCTPAELQKVLDAVGFVFLFAPAFHPSLKAVGAVRRSLGVRTVFNLLGPLANPAGAKIQLIGVWDSQFLDPMIEALRLLGAVRALVVHSRDGIDEISPCAVTEYRLLQDGSILSGEIPSLGLDPGLLTPRATVQENAAHLRSALVGAEPHGQALIPNTAATLWLAGVGENYDHGAALALQSLQKGRGRAVLDHLIQATQL